MAQRRMFSQKIVSSDAFLDMGSSARELYFHLGMYADDDGFINPKKIMRMIGASDDDIKLLCAKRFVIPFENGVVVIKHWKINNLIRKDWYQPTIYTEQMKLLTEKDNGSYTESNPVNKLLTKSQHSIVKSSIVKISLDTPKGVQVKPETFGKPELNELIDYLKEKQGILSLDGSVKWNRIYAGHLLKKLSNEVGRVKKFIDYALSDPFHQKNATSFKYLWNNLNKIALTAKNNQERNPNYDTNS
jgi:hypothetical protein